MAESLTARLAGRLTDGGVDCNAAGKSGLEPF